MFGRERTRSWSPGVNPEVADDRGAGRRQRAGHLHRRDRVRLLAVAVRPGRGDAGEIADVGQEILRAHDVADTDSDRLAECLRVGVKERALRLSGEAYGIE